MALRIKRKQRRTSRRVFDRTIRVTLPPGLVSFLNKLCWDQGMPRDAYIEALLEIDRQCWIHKANLPRIDPGVDTVGCARAAAVLLEHLTDKDVGYREGKPN